MSWKIELLLKNQYTDKETVNKKKEYDQNFFFF